MRLSKIRLCQRLPILLTGLLVAGGAQAGAPLHLEYDVYYKGLRALTAQFDLTLNPRDYLIQVRAETTGLVGVFVSWRTSSISSGLVTEAGVVPVFHAQRGVWRGKQRSVTLQFEDDAPVAVDVTPSAPQDERETVPQELTIDTFDMLSAVVGIQHAVANGRGCGGEWPVFDGRRRYNLIVEPIGEAVLEPSNQSSYAGPALRCSVRHEAVAGASHDRDSRQRNPASMEIWLAPVEAAAYPVLVRIQARGPFGVATAHLREAEQVARPSLPSVRQPAVAEVDAPSGTAGAASLNATLPPAP
jgi:hypothetical protein